MQDLNKFIVYPFKHTNGKIFNNKKYYTQCDVCYIEIGFRIKIKHKHICSSCSAKQRIKKYGNPMQGRSQDASKFRNTYSNVNYKDFKLNIRNKRHYKMTCITCSADRGYKIHNEATRSCLKCHAKKYTKKSTKHKRIYNSIKANISQRFRWRKINKDTGAFRHLPYTLDQLIKHLEKQFEPWMNWGNYGLYSHNKDTWQIDHIIPDSSFIYNDILCQGFKDSWALSNLRPLRAIDNIKKSNKY